MDRIVESPQIRRLGDLLIEAGLINPDQLQKALGESKQTGEPLGKILLKRNFLSEDQLGEVLSLQAGTAYVKIGGRDFDQSLISLFPANFLWEHKVLPLSIAGQALKVVMVHPNDIHALDEIRLITGLRPSPVVTTAKEFDEAYNVLFSESQRQITEAIASIRQDNAEDISSQRLIDELAIDDHPVVKLIQSILAGAVVKGTSDIHLESRERCMRVRYRIDGVLHDAAEIPKDLEPLAISRIKIISGMDISERRRPQDGRSRFTMDGKNYDLRISTLPNLWGEKVVIRILHPAMLFGGLDSLGLSSASYERVHELIQMPHGIMLITGPTGSGKTTTLYSGLYEMNTPERCILTVEDPIEYPIEGISQTQVSPKAGLTFSNSLRSMLRQDPDVIMVGEIRDKETLDSAVFAALTGHLVLSTIHTNDAANTITRMLEMGLPPYLLSSSLLGVVAQRLVRRICPFCATTYQTKEIPLLDGLPLQYGRGCTRCNQTGYSGRLGIFEVLSFNDEIRDMVDKGVSAYRIRAEAIDQGMETLAVDGLNKVLMGITTIQEISRVLGSSWYQGLCLPTSIAPTN